ncbi:MAG: 4-(cytidine 5'-diphospho)-2-C-methyl-D-erythritol kinase [Deltaproteobacteria bacterium]|nr:4-(cytidine 5'-diphospho)-2-C-methyl-D-erythritol kinase [Deltaproteobacteria bacterium]
MRPGHSHRATHRKSSERWRHERHNTVGREFYMKLRAYAKINLSLEIIKKRRDHFHELVMIMQSVSLYDEISFDLTDRPGICVKTTAPDLPTDDANIVVRLYQYMKEAYSLQQGLEVTLTKNIPIAAGLAGGSANAAATLYAINALFQLNLNRGDLFNICTMFGSDIVFTYYGGSKLATGRGEILEDIFLPRLDLVLINPGVPLSTAAVYGCFKPGIPNPHEAECIAIKHERFHVWRYAPDTTRAGTMQKLMPKRVEKHCLVLKTHDPGFLSRIKSPHNLSPIDICPHCFNHLEPFAIGLNSDVAKLKQQLLDHGAITAMMTGSGPTCFGIFNNADKAKEAFGRLKKTLPPDHKVFLVSSFEKGIDHI